MGLLGIVPLGPLGVAIAVKLATLAAFVGVSRLTGAMTSTEFRELQRFARGMLALAAGLGAFVGDDVEVEADHPREVREEPLALDAVAVAVEVLHVDLHPSEVAEEPPNVSP